MRSRSGQRSKSGVLTCWDMGTRILEPDGSNSGKMSSYAWLTYGMGISGILRDVDLTCNLNIKFIYVLRTRLVESFRMPPRPALYD